MADSAIHDFEQHRAQLAASLTAVAETMRNCAQMAETFASFVQNGAAGLDDIKPGKRKAVADVDDDLDGRKRKRKAKKDPNAPKRPPSSYLLFQNEIRKELKERFPNLSNNDLMAMASEQWKAMTDEQKEIYHEQSKVAKEQYSQNKLAYANRSPEEVAAATARYEAAQQEKKDNAKKARAAKSAAAATAAAQAAQQVARLAETSPSTEDDGSEDESEAETHDAKEESDDTESSEEEAEPTPKKPKKAVPVPTKKGKKGSKA